MATRNLPMTSMILATGSLAVTSLLTLSIKQAINAKIMKNEQKMDSIISSKKAAAQSALEFKLFDSLQFKQLIIL